MAAWARDEPPSPAESEDEHTPTTSVLQVRPSTSATSEGGSVSATTATKHAFEQRGGTSWWTFNRKPGQPSQHEHDDPNDSEQPIPSTSTKLNWPMLNPANAAEKWTRPFRERSKTWLSNAPYFLNEKRRSQETEKEERDEESPRQSGGESADLEERPQWNLHLPPPPREDEFTLTQSRTPGWQTPWTARPSLPANSLTSAAIRLQEGPGHHDSDDEEKQRSKWYIRRKRLRAFILNNNYVPLVSRVFLSVYRINPEVEFQLFRIINIAFATASLVVAIQIRHKEMKFGVVGAVGSSP